MNKKEKDWKERFRDLDFLVKIKDSFGWTNEIDYEVLENFFEQEIDRAREDTEVDRIKWALRELPKLTEGKDFREDNWSVIVEKLKTKLTK